LDQIVAGCKPGQEIHIILDNLSAHKTAKVQNFHNNVHLHFTRTYSSWLNQVEIWFAKIEREVIARGVFRSVPDLAHKLMRYVRAYSKTVRALNGSTPMSAIACRYANELTATGHLVSGNCVVDLR
jgi:hypothetical protein